MPCEEVFTLKTLSIFRASDSHGLDHRKQPPTRLEGLLAAPGEEAQSISPHFHQVTP